MLGLVFDGVGRISDTVSCSFETAAAHAESCRRDDVIDRFCDTFCGSVEQNGQMNRFVDNLTNF